MLPDILHGCNDERYKTSIFNPIPTGTGGNQLSHCISHVGIGLNAGKWFVSNLQVWNSTFFEVPTLKIFRLSATLFFNKPMISKLEYWVKIDWGIVLLLTHDSQNESVKSVIFIERLKHSHENILKCLGISNEPNHLPCLLFEFMQFGDLASILANTRTKNIQRTNLVTLTDVRTL